jgi:ATP-dependent DNA ligase
VRRIRPIDYAGATGHAARGELAGLGARVVVQPKVDGAYARVHLDRRGRIERVFRRDGREFGAELAGHLVGAFVGWPGAILVGELEAHTEAANRVAACRGWRALHLFDCIRAHGALYVAREPYHVRRDYLWRMQSEVVNLGCELPWYEDVHGARSRSTGQFVEAVPTDWRLTPIVPQLPAQRAEAAWDEWVAPGAEAIEGLVAVHLDARLGARRAKRKVKLAQTLDCVVVAIDHCAAVVAYGGQRFVVSARGFKDRDLKPGDVVEVLCDGWHERSVTPRFARLLRLRSDLGATIGG